MKQTFRLILAFVLAFALAFAPGLPIWSQSPATVSSPSGTGIGKNSSYASVPCAKLTAAPPDPGATANSSPFPSTAVEGKDYGCGYLTVPEQHGQPNGKTIQVGIAILKSTNPRPAEPLIMFQGGPGGSSIDIFPGLFLPRNESALKLLSERDLIIFDKRGNRYSKPFLACPEYQEDSVNLDKTATAKTLKTLKACRDRLVQEGVNLAAFNSVESAHDVADLVHTLGYKQVNLYGVSYGTELAQDVLRLHPKIVRSVILDGVVPNKPSLDSQYAVILDRLITQVDAACAQDTDCHALYPNVKATFEAAYTRLNQTPGTIQLLTSKGLEQQSVTGLNLAQTIFELSYMAGAPFVIPALIYRASEGDFILITNFRYMSPSGGIATGTYFSVKCSEDVAYAGTLDSKGVAPFAKEWGASCWT
jgi:pimeloyl-ACP methyl ester carboxylesterase